MIQKFLLKNPFFMFSTNFFFVVSHSKIHSGVHLNTSKALTCSSQKEKFVKILLAFVILMF